MYLNERIEAFDILSQKIKSLINNNAPKEEQILFNELLHKIERNNIWFDQKNINYALSHLARQLSKDELIKWLSTYDDNIPLKNPKRVAVILAGNIPLVGFHDFLCVLITGHIFVGKRSSQDKLLLPYIADLLININQDFKKYIFFKDYLKNEFDAIIATGGDNTFRYFEYYFSKYPHIFRKNRNSIAILDEKETDDDLQQLANDICLYYGKGCRNVSKLFVPTAYRFEKLINSLDRFRYMLENTKYFNNYQYYKTIYLMNNIEFIDTGFMMLLKNEALNAPVGVLYYEYYKDIKTIKPFINDNKDKIQCIVSSVEDIENCIKFGLSQKPMLNDFADGTDTLRFLKNL